MLAQQYLVLFCFTVYTITGGHTATVGKYPHRVSIRFNSKHICSGSIINERHIFTLYSCIFSTPAENLTVIAGTNSLEAGGGPYKIQKIIEPDTLFNDIALLRTHDDIIFCEGVKKIDIDSYNNYDINSSLTIVAWEHPPLGEVRKNDMLQELSFQIYDKYMCNQELCGSYRKCMCIINSTSEQFCYTDQGGAIIADGFQIGIYTNKDSCYDAGKPKVHISVYDYKDWIERNSDLNSGIDELNPIAPDGAYPYHVSIRRKNQHICSGSIINARHILTSIISILSIKAEDLSVMTGTNSLTQGGELYRVENIIPTYDCNFNIAILRSIQNIIFNDRVKSIPIITSSYELNDSERLILTGWQRSNAEQSSSDKLQHISYQVYGREKCKTVIPFLKKEYMCSINPSDQISCQVDYGGPIVANGAQIALNPFGMKCESNNGPHLHLPLSNHSSWIKCNSQPHHSFLEAQCNNSTTKDV